MCSKLEEVISQLNTFQEAFKSRSEQPSLSVPSGEATEFRKSSPNAVAGLAKPPSITVDKFLVRDEHVNEYFFGVGDSVNCALAVGEQTLGMCMPWRC